MSDARSPRGATPQKRVQWTMATAHNTAETTSRFREIARHLPLAADQVAPFVDAAMVATRMYAMECGFANYELRTGRAYPAEPREAEESLQRAHWHTALAELERHRTPVEPPPEEPAHESRRRGVWLAGRWLWPMPGAK